MIASVRQAFWPVIVVALGVAAVGAARLAVDRRLWRAAKVRVVVPHRAKTSMDYPMGLMMKLVLFVVLVGSTLGMWGPRTVNGVMARLQRPGIIVTRIFSGPDGQTHAEDIRMKMAPTDASTEVSEMAKVPGVQFRRQAPNYFEDWHTAPRRQYVITLSGRGEIELSDGKQISLYPGRILFLEDLTGKGHISRGIGTEDRISILIPLAE